MTMRGCILCAMEEEEDRLVPTDYVVESIKADLATAAPSRRNRIFEAIAIAALGGIPWVGGVIAAAAEAAHKIKSGEETAEKDSLLREWLQEHQQRLLALHATLDEMARRLEGFGETMEERITSEDYLTLVRIDRAKFMLKEYGSSLKEVAANCGFHDVAYFCRVFRRITKVTPTTYRLNGL